MLILRSKKIHSIKQLSGFLSSENFFGRLIYKINNMKRLKSIEIEPDRAISVSRAQHITGSVCEILNISKTLNISADKITIVKLKRKIKED